MDLYLKDIRDNSESFQNLTMQIFAMEEDGTNVFVSVKNLKTYLYVGFDIDVSEEIVRMMYVEMFKLETWARRVYEMAVIKKTTNQIFRRGAFPLHTYGVRRIDCLFLSFESSYKSSAASVSHLRTLLLTSTGTRDVRVRI